MSNRESWLSLSRIIYAVGILSLWRPFSARPLASLDDRLFFAPLGPFAWLPGWPPAWAIIGFELAGVAAAGAVLLGVRTRLSSYTLTAVLLLTAGLRYSTGKIDHSLVLYLVPAVLAGAWGSRLALRPERHAPPRTNVLALLVGVTFLTSGLAKALTGWASPTTSATREWALDYIAHYGIDNGVNTWLVGLRIPWELADWLVVGLEMGIYLLLLWRRTVPIAVSIAVLFHLGVLFLLGINFAQLTLVYLPLLSVRASVPERLHPAGAVTLFVVVGALWVTGWTPNSTRATVAAFVLVLVLAVLELWQGGRGWQVPPRLAVAGTALLLVPFAVALTWSEPYPAVIGPLFRGDGMGELRQQWTIDGREVPPTEVFGVPDPYATNLAYFLHPPPGRRGHNFQRVWYHPEPALPEGVRAEWVPVD